MSPNLDSQKTSQNTGGDDALVAKTLRTTALLVAACVLFVGLLSLVAVAVTSKAVGGSHPSSEAAQTDSTAKKPLSI